MSAFRVGQQVRLARPNFARYAGITGRVEELVPERACLIRDAHSGVVMSGLVNCLVRWDDGVCGNQHTSQLEPIVPPHEASQYSYTELMDRLKAGEVECV